jgi:RND family efflux transporter MFP subunit
MTPLHGQTALPILLLTALACSCSKAPDSQPSAQPGKPLAARPVRVAVVETQPMERTVLATGSLLAQEQATLSIKVPGRLHFIGVDLGSVVKKGDLLAQVDPKDYELRVRQAAAALAQARAALGLPSDGTSDTVDIEKTSLVKEAQAVLDEAAKKRARVEELNKTGIAAQSELDTSVSLHLVALTKYEAALDEAHTRLAALAQRRAELAIAEKQFEDTNLRAPFDGAIQQRVAGLGEFLQTGTPVLTLVRTDPLRLRVEVPEREAASVRTGQPVRLRVEGESNLVRGALARVSPAIVEQSRMLIAEADIRNDGSLRPGLFVRAEIVTRERDPGLAIPAGALIVFAGIEKVVLARDGMASERTVVTGRRGSGWIEIVSGLKAGEIVVVDPGNLRTGQPLIVADPPAQTSRSMESSGP